MDKAFLSAIEALLFVSGEPLSLIRLSEILEYDPEVVLKGLDELQQSLAEEERGVRLAEVSGGWQLVSAEEFESFVGKLSMTVKPKLSSAMVEVLAIISYRQPVTKQEIEQVRGVDCSRAIKQLHELELIEDQGRKEVVGKPILYGTTSKFLHTFGLKNIESLPRWEEFQEEEEITNEGETPENNS